MENIQQTFFYRNIPNMISIFGVIPLLLLFAEDGYQYLIPLIIFNNIMDDLDGIAAAKLNLHSRFGADLDNVCDAVAHVAITLAVGAHFGGIVAITSMVAAGAIILRVATRVNPEGQTGNGSPTNELMRHLLFVLLLTQTFDVDPTVYLAPLFLLHSASLVAPYKLPLLIRSMTKTATTVILLNIALVVAWLMPAVTPFIAAAFIGTHLYSFVVEGRCWLIERANATHNDN
jgi:phosphatidylserine synthase